MSKRTRKFKETNARKQKKISESGEKLIIMNPSIHKSCPFELGGHIFKDDDDITHADSAEVGEVSLRKGPFYLHYHEGIYYEIIDIMVNNGELMLEAKSYIHPYSYKTCKLQMNKEYLKLKKDYGTQDAKAIYPITNTIYKTCTFGEDDIKYFKTENIFERSYFNISKEKVERIEISSITIKSKYAKQIIRGAHYYYESANFLGKLFRVNKICQENENTILCITSYITQKELETESSEDIIDDLKKKVPYSIYIKKVNNDGPQSAIRLLNYPLEINSGILTEKLVASNISSNPIEAMAASKPFEKSWVVQYEYDCVSKDITEIKVSGRFNMTKPTRLIRESLIMDKAPKHNRSKAEREKIQETKENPVVTTTHITTSDTQSNENKEECQVSAYEPMITDEHKIVDTNTNQCMNNCAEPKISNSQTQNVFIQCKFKDMLSHHKENTIAVFNIYGSKSQTHWAVKIMQNELYEQKYSTSFIVASQINEKSAQQCITSMIYSDLPKIGILLDVFSFPQFNFCELIDRSLNVLDGRFIAIVIESEKKVNSYGNKIEWEFIDCDKALNSYSRCDDPYIEFMKSKANGSVLKEQFLVNELKKYMNENKISNVTNIEIEKGYRDLFMQNKKLKHLSSAEKEMIIQMMTNNSVYAPISCETLIDSLHDSKFSYITHDNLHSILNRLQKANALFYISNHSIKFATACGDIRAL